MKDLIISIARADLDTPQHDYVVDCLKAAVMYCKEQFESSNSEIDALPSISSITTELEDTDKFRILETYLNDLL